MEHVKYIDINSIYKILKARRLQENPEHKLNLYNGLPMTD